jgi:predicted amidohydrolase
MVAVVAEEAATRPTDLVVFPEMATTGYLPETYDEEFHHHLRARSEPVPGPTTERLGAAARDAGAYVAFGMSERGRDGELHNSVVLVGPDGEVAASHRKVHLFRSEEAYFRPGTSFDVHDTALGRIGLSVCYDSKFPEAARTQALQGADLLLAIFAYSPDPDVPLDILEQRAGIRAWENGLYYAVANQLSRNGGPYVGRSAVAGPSGRLLTQGRDRHADVVRATLSAAELKEWRSHSDPLADLRLGAYAPSRPTQEG